MDTRQAGDAPLDVTVMDANYQPIKLEAKDNKNGIYDFSYRPTRGNKHTIQVRFVADHKCWETAPKTSWQSVSTLDIFKVTDCN